MKKLFTLLMIVIPSTCFAWGGWLGGTGITNVQTVNGSTVCGSPTGLKVNNSTLTCNDDGTATIVNSGSTGGTVTSTSFSNGNGFTGSVANPTSTPAISVGTSITGLLLGNGSAVSAAVPRLDYAPATSGSSLLYGDGAGGFSNVTIGSNLTFSDGTLSASTGGGGSGTINAGTTTHIPTYSGSTTLSDSKVAITSPSTLATLIFGIDNSNLTFQGSGTVVNRDSTDSFTNKQYDTAGAGNTFKINGTTITSISGNTAKVGTTSGSLISGNCAKFDASGNIVDNGSTCGAGGGSGTVNSGTAGQAAYYPSSTTTVGGYPNIALANTLNSSSGVDNPYSLAFAVTETGTAGYTARKTNVTETSTGSGTKLLEDWQIAGSSKANLDNTGAFTGISFNTNGTAAGLLKLKEPSGTGSTYVALQAPASISSSLTFTLPSVDGSNGQSLTTNGSGTLSWANSASQWTTTGSDIYYSTGKVGIGTTAPLRLLDVVTSDATTGASSISSMAALKNTNTTNNNGAALGFQTLDTNGVLNSGGRIVSIFTSHSPSAISGDLEFETANAGTSATRMTISQTGSLIVANAAGGSAASLCVDTSGKLGKVTGGTLTSPTCTTF